jgi:hypothetical protein
MLGRVLWGWIGFFGFGSVRACLFDVSIRVFGVGSGFWALGRVSPCRSIWCVGSGSFGLDRVFGLWVGSTRASLFDVSGQVGSGFWALGRVGSCLPVWPVGGLGFWGWIRFFGFGSGQPVPPFLTCRVGFFRVGSGFLALGRVSPCLPVWRVGSGFVGLDRVFWLWVGERITMPKGG